MSGREALVVLLPAQIDAPPAWLRAIDDAVVQHGTGTDWLTSCGLAALPNSCTVMLVTPVETTTLHWIAMPDLPVRQGRAAARISALDASIGHADTMVAAADEQPDATQPHLVAVAARSDVQHWLLWAQHHGLDPDIILPAGLGLPEPQDGFVRGQVGDSVVLRGTDAALLADDPIASVILGDAAVVDLSVAEIEQALLAAVRTPTVNLRQGDFAKRTTMTVDRPQLARIALWCGFIALVSLAIAFIAIVKLNADASGLDDDSVTVAQAVVPNANDVIEGEQEIDRQLMIRGSGPYGFTGPTAGLFTAMRGAPSVGLTLLDRAPDGLLKATLAAAKADDINVVLLALQASGFTITATSSQDPSGRVLADITVRP